jgi:hypothetical protein
MFLPRREFFKQSAGLLAALGLAPLVRAMPAAMPQYSPPLGLVLPSLDDMSINPATIPQGGWGVMSRVVTIGLVPKTVLQLEPLGSARLARSVLVGESAQPVQLELRRQLDRCSGEPTTVFSRGAAPQHSAWQDGFADPPGRDCIHSATCRGGYQWLAAGDCEPCRPPERLGVVAWAERPIRVRVIMWGLT